jgi:hypothetical protein
LPHLPRRTAPFGDVLNEADADAIHAYIIEVARKQLQEAK